MKSKMYRGLLLLFAFVLMVALTACAAFPDPSSYHNLPDQYNKGTDYTANFTGTYLPVMTAGENGYYFAADEFLFYLEPEAGEAVYLCNRPECNHWDETCSAHVYRDTNDLVQYYEGKLYVVANEYDDRGVYSCLLYEINPSDCTRKVVCKLPYGIDDTVHYMMHRGYLYMFVNKLSEGRLTAERVALNELEEKSLEPEMLFSGKSLGITAPYLYGNHFFVCFVEDVGYYKYNWKDIDVRTGEAKDVVIPDAEEGSFVQIFSDYDGKVVLAYVSPERATFGKNDMEYYSYDCTTGAVEPLVHFPDRGEPAYEHLHWDGENPLTFFYDQAANSEEEIQVTQEMRILDEKFETEKTLPIDMYITGYMVGDENYAFVGHDDGKYTLYAIDKSDEELSFTKVFEVSKNQLSTRAGIG